MNRPMKRTSVAVGIALGFALMALAAVHVNRSDAYPPRGGPRALWGRLGAHRPPPTRRRQPGRWDRLVVESDGGVGGGHRRQHDRGVGRAARSARIAWESAPVRARLDGDPRRRRGGRTRGWHRCPDRLTAVRG